MDPPFAARLGQVLASAVLFVGMGMIGLWLADSLLSWQTTPVTKSADETVTLLWWIPIPLFILAGGLATAGTISWVNQVFWALALLLASLSLVSIDLFFFYLPIGTMLAFAGGWLSQRIIKPTRALPRKNSPTLNAEPALSLAEIPG